LTFEVPSNFEKKRIFFIFDPLFSAEVTCAPYHMTCE